VVGGSVQDQGTQHWERQLPLFNQKILKGAVVSGGLKRLVASAIVMTARLRGMELAERVRIFGDRQEAIDWVSQD